MKLVALSLFILNLLTPIFSKTKLTFYLCHYTTGDAEQLSEDIYKLICPNGHKADPRPVNYGDIWDELVTCKCPPVYYGYTESEEERMIRKSNTVEDDSSTLSERRKRRRDAFQKDSSPTTPQKRQKTRRGLLQKLRANAIVPNFVRKNRNANEPSPILKYYQHLKDSLNHL